MGKPLLFRCCWTIIPILPFTILDEAGGRWSATTSGRPPVPQPCYSLHVRPNSHFHLNKTNRLYLPVVSCYKEILQDQNCSWCSQHTLSPGAFQQNASPISNSACSMIPSVISQKSPSYFSLKMGKEFAWSSLVLSELAWSNVLKLACRSEHSSRSDCRLLWILQCIFGVHFT